MRNTRKAYTVDEALMRLQRYCAYQERCHFEVRAKLKDMGMIPEAADAIIVTLIRDDYLNESRFVEAFIRGKFRQKHWGKHRIKRELLARDISAPLIRRGLDTISDSEYVSTLDTIAKKYLEHLESKEPNRLKRKRKLANYLLYRGWESHLVYDKVNTLVR